MTIYECLVKMDLMFEKRGSKPEADSYHSSMSHAHAVIKEGIAACESQTWAKATFALGFGFGRMVGLGVFDLAKLKELAKDIGAVYYSHGG